MTIHSSYRFWQKRWTFVDGVAIHESGLRVETTGRATNDRQVLPALARDHGTSAVAVLNRLKAEGAAVVAAGGPSKARLKG